MRNGKLWQLYFLSSGSISFPTLFPLAVKQKYVILMLLLRRRLHVYQIFHFLSHSYFFFSSWWGSLLILTREAVLSFNPFSRVSCLRRISTQDVSLDKAERSGIQAKDDDDGEDCERRSSWILVSFPDNLKIKERRRTDPQNEVLENGMKEKLPEV